MRRSPMSAAPLGASRAICCSLSDRPVSQVHCCVVFWNQPADLAMDAGRVRHSASGSQYKGQRIFQRLGAVRQGDAERANSLRRGGERMWAAAATKYLKEMRPAQSAHTGDDQPPCD